MKLWTIVLAVAAATVFSGCATCQQPYKPTQTGRIDEASREARVTVSLASDHSHLKIGQPLQLEVRVRNDGAHAVEIADIESMDLIWIYPDGRRDMIIRDTAPRAGAVPTILKPGEELVSRPLVQTAYFKKRGITEFHAALETRPHTPDSLQVASASRTVSNGFGVMIER